MGELKPRAIKTRSIVGGGVKLVKEHSTAFFLGETNDGRFALELFVRDGSPDERPITILFDRAELIDFCNYVLRDQEGK